ncbi:aminoglycoside 6-adenylyltransferase [Lacticaseibacillus mingshuiensis]|uniref:Aminoglycoside 6-adenylyltransferase n=1 Tax=Lacticaseibacillus mingshuiensis TaxID=2799574 RepID=A0ABW4CH53_9LACO|nr:aminoglycoside 6-adenylyltransferase [Lacticaseibacillus mingshuiensis]
MDALERILKQAGQDANVVAVGTEGSTNDGQVAGDRWTDLDVTVFVDKLDPTAGWQWLTLLGEPTNVQYLKDEAIFGPNTSTWYSWLTRYSGTMRMDFKMAPAEDEAAYLEDDTLNAIVWRRGLGKVSPRPTSAASHFIGLPDQALFTDRIIEFYWCAGNVIKGLSRGNLMYANEQFNHYVRPELIRLFAWRASLARGGRFDAGVSGKFVWHSLSLAEQKAVAATYHQDSLANARASLIHAIALYNSELPDLAAGLALDLPERLSATQHQFVDWFADETLWAQLDD